MLPLLLEVLGMQVLCLRYFWAAVMSSWTVAVKRDKLYGKGMLRMLKKHSENYLRL